MPNTLKWRDDPVYDLEGVTRDLEQLQTILLAGTLKGETLKGALTGELPEPVLRKAEYTSIGTERAAKTEFEVSATRPATVIWVNTAGKTTAVKVNKVNILPESIVAGAALSFKVPTAQKWEWEGEGAGHSTYILE